MRTCVSNAQVLCKLNVVCTINQHACAINQCQKGENGMSNSESVKNEKFMLQIYDAEFNHFGGHRL